MNKKEILDKIKSLDGLNNDEKAFLINLVNTKKKYGLVWEDKPEDVEEELRTKLPVLKEVKERAIVNDTDTEHYPNHILIEGDNLHALTALTFTHEGKIDLIYIDPPYNTGNKDFVYNDNYVDKEDGYRHSKWLSFMEKRLSIAQKLLAEHGVILLSIDDNEKSQLKLLCDEVFHDGFIACLPRITKSSGKTTNKIASNHDYLLVYSKNKTLAIIEGLDHFDKGFKFEDEYLKTRGLYKLNQTLDYDSLQYSSSLDYEIEIDGEKFYPGSDYNAHIKRKNGSHSRADWAWRWSKDLFDFGLKKGFIVVKKSKNGSRIYTKTYLNAKIEKNEDGSYFIDYFDRKKPLTSLEFTDKLYSNDNAKKQLSVVLKQQIFDYPKPIGLVQTFLKTIPNKNINILDFFAGTGTTLHGVIKQNKEDNGNRNCILVTNNENQIAEKVTYERNKRVILGYTKNKGEIVDGIMNNNLRYYQCDFVDREPSLANKRQLTHLATELLCIKEDCYKEITFELADKTWHKFFTGANSHYVYIIYDDAFIEEAVERLKAFITQNPDAQIKVYVFSNGQYAYAEEFEEIAVNIRLAALPDAIYKAYQYILPKQNKEFIPELEEETPVEFDNGIKA
jgi:adenine-specific DNA-methyltransferase